MDNKLDTNSRSKPVNGRRTIAKREVSRLRSEKTILLAIIVQLLIASFSSVLVAGVVSVYSPSDGSGGSIEYAVTGESRPAVMESIEDTSGAVGVQYDTLEEAKASYEEGRTNAIIHATTDRSGRLDVTVYAPRSGLMKALVISRGKTVLEKVEDQRRSELSHRLSQSPLPEPEPSDPAPQFEFIYTMLVPLLVFLPAFISGALVVDSFTEGFERGTFELLQTAPVSDTAILDGKLLALAGIAPVQICIWIGLLGVNGISLVEPATILAVGTGVSFLVVSLGAAISMYWQDRGQGQFIYSLASLLVFSTFYVLPVQPVNLVAKLAIGTVSLETSFVALVILSAGCLAFASVRRYVSSSGIR